MIPGEGETCQSILAYLNNPMSTGKSYCGGTAVRGGWVQVDCKTGKSSIRRARPGPHTKPGSLPRPEEELEPVRVIEESPALAVRIVSERIRVSETARH